MDLSWADYGMAGVAVSAVTYIATKRLGVKSGKSDSDRMEDELTSVLLNNTKALESNTKAMEAVATIARSMELSLARQETMLKEVVERCRNA